MEKFRKNWIELWKRSLPILFAHHPDCKRFTHHTINIRTWRFCIGCFIGYPTAFLSLVFWQRWYYTRFSSSPWILIVAFFLFSSIGLSLTSLTKNKGIKIFQKFLIGFSAGMIIAYFMNYIEMEEWWKRLIVFYGIVSLLITPIGILHYRTMRRMCKTCPYIRDPDYCDLDYCMANNSITNLPPKKEDSHQSETL